ncbi:MAG: lytic transglycosylase domain-containing protein [Candidatus Binatia bacterium]
MQKQVRKGIIGLLGVLITFGGTFVGSTQAKAEIRVYRDSKGVLYITNKLKRPVKSAGTAKPRYKWGAGTRVSKPQANNSKEKNNADFTGRLIDVKSELAERRRADRYVHDPSTTAPIHVYRNKQGTLLFTNVPNQPGYRPFLFLRSYATRLSSKDSLAFDRLIRSACRRYGVEFELVKAVIRAESAFNPWAVSRAGARGLMQLMPATAADHGVADIHSPRDNIDGGVRHLRILLDRFNGNVMLALAAYNAGAGAVEKYNGIPPYQETQEYVRKVLRFRDSYRGRSGHMFPVA